MTTPPFATLLRRSKFVAFDPLIAQVYTTHQANAHRGNWGLKRPLPLRKRNSFITIKSVDSPEQQTEWNHAESQVRFIRRWEELRVDPKIAPSSQSERAIGIEAAAIWMVDSEFAPATDCDFIPNGQSAVVHAVPNIHAMTNSQFRTYLEKLRKQRPQFQAYMQHLAENDQNAKLQGKSRYELASSPKAYHRKFISWSLGNQLNSMDSRAIEQKPHRTGGISYSHTSALETLFTTKHMPGIILQRAYQSNDSAKMSRSDEAYIASFAGLTPMIRLKNAGGKIALLDATSEEGINRENIEKSITNLRITNRPRLVMSPKVVGKWRQGLKGAKIEAEVISDLKTNFDRDNPHPPASREYIALEPRLGASVSRAPPMDFRPRKKKTHHKPTGTGKVVLDTLRNIIKIPNPYHGL